MMIDSYGCIAKQEVETSTKWTVLQLENLPVYDKTQPISHYSYKYCQLNQFASIVLGEANNVEVSDVQAMW